MGSKREPRSANAFARNPVAISIQLKMKSACTSGEVGMSSSVLLGDG